jgi:D-glycero-D-manno-heptose 1,7-bisphosphate phosphatase
MINDENMTLCPAVFLDRDGTIIEDRGHLRDPSQVVFFQDTFDALRRLQEHFLLFVVTNQSGVAEGVLTRSDVDQVNAHIVTRLVEEGVRIENVYVCPHRPIDGCSCIKPQPYFLKEAAVRHQIDMRESFVIGDHPHDVLLARNAGAFGIYVLTGHGARHFGELPKRTLVVTGIWEAATHILKKAKVV